jgi:hypothetical protein
MEKKETATVQWVFARFHPSRRSISILLVLAWGMGCLVIWGWQYISHLPQEWASDYQQSKPHYEEVNPPQGRD